MKFFFTKLATSILCSCALIAQAQTNVFPSSGNVGIGTITPSAKLHLYNGSGQSIQFLTGSNTSGYIVSVGVNDDGVNFSNNSSIRGFNFSNNGGQRINFLTGSNSSGYKLSIGINDDGVNFSNNSFVRGFNFKNANGNLLGILSSGSVTIGPVSSTPAGYKLFVTQGILTEKVKVAVESSASWADYVFQENYSLPSLQEVEKYIQQNKHLPNIPSAEEMINEGNDLGATDAKLLAKIEELTLYLIEVKRENGNMLKQIDQLKAEVINLKKNVK